jgi:hypothetical protein
MVEIGAGNDVSAGRFVVLKFGPVDVMDKAKAATPTSSLAIGTSRRRASFFRSSLI